MPQGTFSAVNGIHLVPQGTFFTLSPRGYSLRKRIHLIPQGILSSQANSPDEAILSKVGDNYLNTGVQILCAGRDDNFS
jgi:hypothetical protein